MSISYDSDMEKLFKSGGALNEIDFPLNIFMIWHTSTVDIHLENYKKVYFVFYIFFLKL